MEKENKSLKRQIRRLEHKVDAINAMYESAVNLRDFAAKEKDKQNLFNQLMLDALPTVLIMFDTGLNYVLGTRDLIHKHFNDGKIYDLTSLSMKEIFGSSLPDAWIESTEEKLRSTLLSAESMYYYDTIERNDGTLNYTNITISPARSERGEVLGVLFLMHDITEVVRLKDKAEAASEAKSNFLANMSHEIRTPMNAILNMTALLDTTDLNETQHGYVRNVLKASDSLLNIINDILDFSKIGANKLELSIDTYKITDLVSDVVSLINLRAFEKDLNFTIHMAPDMPCRLIGDELRIKQVLINILSNAVKYTNSGYISLHIKTDELDQDNVMLICEITDTGIGIQEEAMKQLFIPFAQLDLKKNRGIQGTGLGLSISMGLAKAMNGDITVKSEYGRGSTFTFLVPQPVQNTEAIVSYVPDRETRILVAGEGIRAQAVTEMLSLLNISFILSTTEENLFYRLRSGGFSHIIYWGNLISEHIKNLLFENDAVKISVKRYSKTLNGLESRDERTLYEPLLITDLVHVLTDNTDVPDEKAPGSKAIGAFQTQNVLALVVDDNMINCIVAEEILKQYNIQVKIAKSGEEALQICSLDVFDIIFMDHMMPGMDGIETTHAIRDSDCKNAAAPIVALTANAIVGTKEKFLENEMDDYLSKPLDIALLNEVLLKFLPVEKIV